MSITTVQPAVAGSGVTPYAGLVLGSAVVAHSTLVAIGSVFNGADGTSQAAVSDSVNGAWPAAIMGTLFNGERSFIAVLGDTAAGTPTLTVSQTGPGNNCRLSLYELSGAVIASPIGVSAAAGGTGSVPSISLPGVSSGSALFAALVASGTPVPDPSWVDGGVTGTWNSESLQYLLNAGAAGTKVAAWTPSQNWGGLVVEILAAGGSPPATPETLFVPLVRRVRRWLRR